MEDPSACIGSGYKQHMHIHNQREIHLKTFSLTDAAYPKGLRVNNRLAKLKNKSRSVVNDQGEGGVAPGGRITQVVKGSVGGNCNKGL